MSYHTQHQVPSGSNHEATKTSAAEAIRSANAWRKSLEASMDRQTLPLDYPELVQALVGHVLSLCRCPSDRVHQMRLNEITPGPAVTGPLVTDILAPILEEIWEDEDKNAAIWEIQQALVKWDRRTQRMSNAVPPATGPPILSRKTNPKHVDFPPEAKAAALPPSKFPKKGKSRAPTPPGSSEDEPSEPPTVHRRTSTVNDKRKRVESESEEDSVGQAPARAPTPPPKKKRVISEKYIEISEEEVDELSEVAGTNPYPCGTCVERARACEWLVDTTRKVCRLCASLKCKCSTIEENKLALEGRRRALLLEQRRTGLSNPDMSQVKEFQEKLKPVMVAKPPPKAKAAPPPPAPITAPVPPAPPAPALSAIRVKKNKPAFSGTVVSGVAQAASAAAAAATASIEAKSREWQTKFSGGWNSVPIFFKNAPNLIPPADLQSEVTRLQAKADLRQTRFQTTINEYGDQISRLEGHINSLTDWIGQRILAVHQKANERNAWVEEAVGEMAAQMEERSRRLDQNIDTLRHQRELLAATPPPTLVSGTQDVDMKEGHGESSLTVPPAAAPVDTSDGAAPPVLSTDVEMAPPGAIIDLTAGGNTPPSEGAIPEPVTIRPAQEPMEGTLLSTPAPAPSADLPPESSPLTPCPTARPAAAASRPSPGTDTEDGSQATETEEGLDGEPRRSRRGKSAAAADVTPRRPPERKAAGKAPAKKARAG